jgi:hypothetical protein
MAPPGTTVQWGEMAAGWQPRNCRCRRASARRSQNPAPGRVGPVNRALLTRGCTQFDGIGACHLPQSGDHRSAVSHNHVRCQTHQFCSVVFGSRWITGRKPVVDPNIAPSTQSAIAGSTAAQSIARPIRIRSHQPDSYGRAFAEGGRWATVSQPNPFFSPSA